MTDQARPATTPATSAPIDGRRRAVIENVRPAIDGGRFPVKRIVGDTVKVEVDAFADGHDVVLVRLRHRPPRGEGTWTEIPMDGPDNDRWWASFTVDRIGRHEYTIVAWTDRFATWQRDLRTRLEAGQDVAVDLLIGAALVEAAADRAAESGAASDEAALRAWASRLRAPDAGPRAREVGLEAGAGELAGRHADRRFATTVEPPLAIVVDRERARFSAWYELFPRSASPDRNRHGTLRDVIARLPYVAELGFDVLYLPPIHPIGRSFRKGPNNVTDAAADAPGSPWAIGSDEGGHTAVHPQLGTVADLRALVAAAASHGIEVALDIAFQMAPDHPEVRLHPEWFRHRPDGTIQYAENPPKKYQDIVPLDFESEAWRSLWEYLRDVLRFWIGQGVRIFRVDNPHTKPFAFWEWLIGTLKADHPDVLFLAEAFTRPKVMYRLAKVGFSQSYTYFTWRNTKRDLMDYLTELTTTDVHEFFRPNFWPNTPDILHADLQAGGRPMFQARFVLAATLAASYGIYGPVFELGINTPREAGSEEYLDSEKYEQRTWDLDEPDSLRGLISRVNRARRDHPALQSNDGLRFHEIDNDMLLAYSKQAGRDAVLAIVSLDPVQPQSGLLEIPLDAFGLPPGEPYEAIDLLSGAVQTWTGPRATVEIDPRQCAAVLLTLRPGSGR